MPRHLLSVEEVRYLIEEEGLGYAIESHTGAESIENPTLAEMWRKANEMLRAIREYVADKR